MASGPGPANNEAPPAPKLARPVFYAASPRRWGYFLGTLRIVGVFIAAVSLVVVIGILRTSDVDRPDLQGGDDAFREIMDPGSPTVLEHEVNAGYAKLRPQLPEEADFEYGKAITSTPVLANPLQPPMRAAFVAADDDTAWYDLLRNADQLNLVFPAWLAAPLDGVEVEADLDQRVLQLLRAKRLPMIPVLTDDPGGPAESMNARRLLADPESRRPFAASIVRLLCAEKLSGVNVYFPGLDHAETRHLVDFLHELGALARPHGLLVMVSVPWNAADATGNDPFCCALLEIAAAADYLVLLAHDLHTFDTMPGPIAPGPQVARAVDSAIKAVPPNKLILSAACHGYDWPAEDPARPLGYAEAMEIARETEVVPRFDPADGSLHFAYSYQPNRPHEVWLADAAALFNTMRLATDCNLAGIALWQLGDEDSRTWEFYHRDLRLAALQAHPIDLERLSAPDPIAGIAYLGAGNILDIVARPRPGRIALEFDHKRQVITAQTYQQLPTPFVVRQIGMAPDKVVLTFDDGPDHRYTPQVLDILKREGVPAVFFVVGINAEKNLGLLRRMYAEGHEVGNHTFSHPNLSLVGTRRLAAELESTRRLVESATGHSTVLFRPPFNADCEPATVAELLPTLAAQGRHYITVAEAIDPRDWEPGITAAEILRRIQADPGDGNILLLHDAGGPRAQTVLALPQIIRHYREQGCEFVSVARLLGRPRDELMPPLTDRTDRALVKVNWRIAEGLFWGARLLWWLFILATGLSVARTVTVASLALVQVRRRARAARAMPTTPPLVSVIVPAYNEEVTGAATVRTLLASDWPALEILFIDDGSRDRTFETVRRAFENEPRVKVVTQPNGGKAAALNHGIALATGDYVVCIDADTQLAPNAIRELVAGFTGPEVVAVAGNVKIANEVNLLTRWQAIEYITSQSFDRHAFDLLNAIMVIPGAIGAFRKAALVAVGGFTVDTLAEDCEVTVRLLRRGGVVRYQPAAIARTEAPETLRAFMKQRFRWSFGILQTVWKHRDAAFNPRFKGLGLAALPNAIVFQFALPAIAPVADIMMVISLFAGFWRQTLAYYLVFLLVDLLGGVVAFRLERERLGRLWALIPQRFGYRQVMYVVLFRALAAALRGQLVGWGVLKRTGHGQLQPAAKEPP